MSLPSDVIAFVVFCRLRYRPTLRDLSEILAAARGQDRQAAWLDPVFTSHVATVLKTTARSGRGLAWSPLSLAVAELARRARQGRRCVLGHTDRDTSVRPRSRQSQTAEAFWAQLVNRSVS